MKIFKEDRLSNFNFWSGAKDTVKYLTDEEVDTIGELLKDVFPDGMTETQINDFFWFEEDTIAEWLGHSDFEEIVNR